MLFAIAFRWTELTGGENGLGNVRRWAVLDNANLYYTVVAALAFVVLVGLWRFHNSPAGSVLVAIRENEQRAGFIGYHTNRYKLLAFTISASITGFAGVLSVFNHRFASADPMGIPFSGELLAMVVIGGMRSFLGPALGALFYIMFRELLSTYTANWLLIFGLLFVGFIIFSPDGLVGVAKRVLAPSAPSRRKRPPPWRRARPAAAAVFRSASSAKATAPARCWWPSTWSRASAPSVPCATSPSPWRTASCMP
ncbi:branched-chain amino acid ABC transporter permease [Pseudoroseomonas wenyumeiae]